MKKILIAIVFTFLISSNVYAIPVLLFGDEFTGRVASPAWGNESGDWFVNSADMYTGGQYSSVTTLPGLTDFSATLNIVNISNAGVYLRSSDQDNGVLLVIGGKAGTFSGYYWHTIENGVTSPIFNEIEIPGTLHSNKRLKIVVEGDMYKLYTAEIGVPGDATTLTSTFITDKFSSGKFALYDNAPNVTFFDNIQINGEPPIENNHTDAIPEPATMFLFGAGLAGTFFRKYRV